MFACYMSARLSVLTTHVQQRRAQVIGVLLPTRETQMESVAPGFEVVHTWLLRDFSGVNQQEEDFSLCLCPFYQPAFQINEYEFLKN